MWQAVLSDVDLLKNSIPIIAEIIDEAIFNIDQNGISLLSPDRTMVSVVNFKILSTAFEQYKVESKEIAGLNMANLSAMLKRVSSSDKLVLEMEGGRFRIKVKGTSTRTFELPLIDVKTEKPPIEQLNFPVRIELEAPILETGIADAELISDAVTLEASSDSFKMYAKGDTSKATLEIKSGESGLIKLEAKEAVKAQYPLDYLKKMIKASKLAKQLVLEFGPDYPLRLSFKIIDKMSLSFVLAPRVSED